MDENVYEYEYSEENSTMFTGFGGSETEVCSPTQTITGAQIQVSTKTQLYKEKQVNEYPWMLIFADKTGKEQKGCGAALVCYFFTAAPAPLYRSL